MIITQTPFRMSFFGGGTDMESFFKEHGGAVLSTTFDKYCYVNVRHLPRFFDYTTELSYSKTERVTSVEDIQHPAIRNAMKMLDMHEIRLTYEADLPARSGLGTSSSFAVGMLNAFYALKGKYADKKKLADEAIYLERNLCQEAGGWQDQIAASFGGFNRINFSADGYEVLPVIISPERKRQLNQNLMMFFTGFTRFSSDVQKANAAGKVDKTAQLKEMLSLVDDAEKVLQTKNTIWMISAECLIIRGNLSVRQDLLFLQTALMSYIQKESLRAHWEENFLVLAVVASLYFMCSLIVRILCVGRCVTCCIFRSNLRMAVHA